MTKLLQIPKRVRDDGFWLLQIPNQVRDDGCMFTTGPSTGSGTGLDARWRLRCEFQGAGGLGTLCGIQGFELFFGDGGVLVVGGDGFVYVVFGPELAGVHAGAVLGYFVPGGLVFYHP